MKDSPNAFTQSNTVLLLLERREDPVTPLMTQWTYQVKENLIIIHDYKAMLHELLEIKNNRIDLRKDKDYAGKEDAEAVKYVSKAINNIFSEKEFVISQHNDHFFETNFAEDFGQLAESVRKELEEYTSVRQQSEQIDSIGIHHFKKISPLTHSITQRRCKPSWTQCRT